MKLTLLQLIEIRRELGIYRDIAFRAWMNDEGKKSAYDDVINAWAIAECIINGMAGSITVEVVRPEGSECSDCDGNGYFEKGLRGTKTECDTCHGSGLAKYNPGTPGDFTSSQIDAAMEAFDDERLFAEESK